MRVCVRLRRVCVRLSVRACVTQSVVMRHARAAVVAQGKHVEVTGATGLVASASGGRTLHSWAGVGLGQESKEVLLERVRKDQYATQRWQQVHSLFVDEVSFIDGHLFDALEYIASKLRCRPRFGGIQLVLCGDFLQLPPVRRASDPPSQFAFECDAWRRCVDVVVELRTVHRQHNDPEFVRYQLTPLRDARRLPLSVLRSSSCLPASLCNRILADVRLGRVTSNVEAAMTAAARPLPARRDGVLPTDVHCTRSGSDAVNTAELAKLRGHEHVYNAKDTGNPTSLQHCIVPARLSLKVGYDRSL